MTTHNQAELTSLAANVIRDMESDDPVRLGKLIERACRHYHEMMAEREPAELRRPDRGELPGNSAIAHRAVQRHAVPAQHARLPRPCMSDPMAAVPGCPADAGQSG